MYAPIARISNVLARHRVDPGRNRRRNGHANADLVAHVNEAVVALHLR